jgi:transcriptional regulator with XRE-family HTH domain
MEVYEKIRFIRLFKGWSQEDMASKLEISQNSYAKIERGETDVNFSRLKQIAETLSMELSELLNLNEKSVVHLAGSNYIHLNLNGEIHYDSHESSELKHKLEIEELKNKESEKENSLLKQQISDLRDMVSFLKKEL